MVDATDEDETETADRSVPVAVVRIGSEGPLEDDEVAQAIISSLEAGGHEIALRELIAGNYDNVQGKVSRLVDRDDVGLVVTAGGTGVTPDDAALEAVEPLLDKELPAFLDLFHSLSYEELGVRVVSSRALAGVTDGVPIFCLPDDTNATIIAVEEIISPEAGRLTTLASGSSDGPVP
ncbi:MogA/MoaB family molybdenum cofactor biosynthesis protein [Natrononativus amylolyticus]|uniref:MogA/MoaB family molybdenum cofactor biosynthesis protein n=1 Tax=Natrononativus amylolyticus TaxID=2963434 RepID=UPI0020CF0D60|nr:molybdopterin-binding protein [Natrononativus amylolyticus]